MAIFKKAGQYKKIIKKISQEQKIYFNRKQVNQLHTKFAIFTAPVSLALDLLN